MTKATQWGYVLGLALIVASAVYFFAANWPVLARVHKLFISGVLTVLFYGAWYLFYRYRLPQREFLAKLFLFAGVVSFGIGTALIGQVYNSHADSFLLFFIWLIPAFFFALITRYPPFAVLCYVLVHLTVWFYFDQAGFDETYSFSLFAAGNAVFFFLLRINRFLTFLSFFLFHLSMFVLTLIEVGGFWLHFLYITILAAGLYYFYRLRRDTKYAALQILAATVYLFGVFIDLIDFFGATQTYFTIGLIIAVLLIAAVSRLRKRMVVLTVSFTVLGAAVGYASLLGLLTLVSGWDDSLFTVLFFAALFGFSFPALLTWQKRPYVARPLFLFGYAASAVVSFFHEAKLYLMLWLAFALFAFFWARAKADLAVLLFVLQLFAFIHGNERFHLHWHEMALIMGSANALSLFLLRKASMFFSHNVYVYTLFWFFVATFAEWQTVPVYAVNLLFFLATTGGLYVFYRRTMRFQFAVTLCFWFLFVAVKYYDLAWPLLHKSLSFFLFGAIVLAVTLFFDRNDERVAPKPMRVSYILLVILLQAAITVYQIASSEWVLANGREIKLKVEPVDPRSLLQGDYIVLNYTISQLPVAIPEGMRKVRIVLAPDEQGVYQFKDFYDERRPLLPSEVVINGTAYGDRFVRYGIEHYFIAEGSGAAVVNRLSYVYVRVSTKGDALIARLAP